MLWYLCAALAVWTAVAMMKWASVHSELRNTLDREKCLDDVINNLNFQLRAANAARHRKEYDLKQVVEKVGALYHSIRAMDSPPPAKVDSLEEDCE